jgi:hypothetical protein
MVDVTERVTETNLSGGQLLTLSSDEILDMLQIGQYSTLFNFCQLVGGLFNDAFSVTSL